MEEKIHSEVSFTIQHLKNLLLSCEKDYMMMYDADRFLEVPNLNVIWGLVAALRYDFNDPQPKKQFQHLRTFLGEKLAGKNIYKSNITLKSPSLQKWMLSKKWIPSEMNLFMNESLQKWIPSKMTPLLTSYLKSEGIQFLKGFTRPK